jgi:hypothetical protein
MPWFLAIIFALGDAVAYCGAAGMFYFLHPVIDRNYSQELMASWSDTPVEDRGIELFRQAVRALPARVDDVEIGKGGTVRHYPKCVPSDPDWNDFVRGVSRRQESLTLVRRAMDKPVLGVPLRLGDDPSLYARRGEATDPEARDVANPPLLAVLMPHASMCREFARTLAADCWLAAGSARDPSDARLARIRGNLHAMLALSQRLRESPRMLLDLVSMALLAIHDDTLRSLVLEYPGLLDDPSLASAALELTAIRWPDSLAARIEGETPEFEDYIQRTYSRTRDGDGYLCFDGFMMRQTYAGKEARVSPREAWRLPLAAMFKLPTRRAELDGWCCIADAYRRDLASAPWLRTHLEFEAERHTIETRWASSGRSQPLSVIRAESLRSALEASDRMRLDRDATLLVIALERFRLANGRWPREHAEVAALLAGPPLLDPFDGAPLRFVIREGRPVVYSIGADRKDDLGRPAGDEKSNRRAGDWCPPSEKDSAPQGDFVIWPAIKDSPPTSVRKNK